jgi:hypothetical protein
VGFKDFNITIIHVRALSGFHKDGIGSMFWMSLGLCWDCKYAELIKNHGLEISQPGFEPGEGLTWEMTKH